MSNQLDTSTEMEAKLIPDDGFRMPTLHELSGIDISGIDIASQPARHLDATYYDTSDLKLARWGITLRHRSGEPGRPWTLKLPRQVSDTRITREELTFAGDKATVPGDARDLVRVFTQDQPLTSVARLRTTRAATQVRDIHGQNLIEIVEDSVDVLHDGRVLDHFREVEIEAGTDNRKVRTAMKQAVAALLVAGCHAERPLPKLIRALGEPAQRPPSLVVAPIGRKASTASLLAHLSTSSAVELLTHDPGVRLGRDPEAVHLYRVAARRLRADLGTFSRFLETDPTDALRAELQWLGRAAGKVRDLDVLAARFVAGSSSLADLDQPAATLLLAHLAARRQDAHQSLLEEIRSERYDNAIRALVDYASAPPIAPDATRKASRPADGFARRVVRRRWDQLAAIVDAADENPTDAQLHQIRIAAKRCRYAAEAVAPVIGEPARRFAVRVEEVQTVLGDYNDTVVAEAWLRDAGVELTDCRIAIGSLVAAEREARAEIRRAWANAWSHASMCKARAWL